MSSTAVVILNYNGEGFLKQFLPAVIANSPNAEIVVADNASTDQSVDLLTKEFPTVRVIPIPTNLGYAGGYNFALKKVQSDYYVLLNSDIAVTKDWLLPMIHFLDDHPSYAACQPNIKDYRAQEKFEYAGAAGGFIDFLGYPYCRGRIFDRIESDSGQYAEPIDIFWASGACLFIRSTVFHEAGGFDEDFFAHMEEIDLCWRIHSLRYHIRSIPSSEVFHVGGGTLSKSSSFKTFLNFRNGLFLLIKNLSIPMLIMKLPCRILLDWIAAMKFLLEGNAPHSIAVLKAHFHAFRKLNTMLKKRKLISLTPKSKLLIFEYFLKGKRKYSEL